MYHGRSPGPPAPAWSPHARARGRCVRAERADGPEGRRLRGRCTSPISKDAALAEAIRDVGRRGAGRPIDQGHRGDARRRAAWRWSSAPAPATTPSTSPRRRARGIYVSNCPGKNAIAVAELTFALILALDRRIPDNVADLRAGTLEQEASTRRRRGLAGQTLGVARRRRDRARGDRAGARLRHAGACCGAAASTAAATR